MKKIILSAVVTAMALTTAVSALEDIKVSGKAKLWYETWDKGDASLFNKDNAVAQQTFELGMTGKQGNVGFGAKIIDASEFKVLGNARDNTADDGLTVSEMYITAPMGSKTTLKIGKQQIQTPFAFSENWMSVPNTFNAALIVSKVTDNLTLVGAYVGQGNTDNTTFKVSDNGRFTTYMGTDTFAAVAHYKTKAFSANFYAYELSSIANAFWLDAGAKLGPVALKVIGAQVMGSDSNGVGDTTGLAISAGMKAGSFSLSLAASNVSDGDADKFNVPIGNTATNFKKTKLPTAGVYTDGIYVAQPGSTAIKLKAVTKLAGFKIIAQGINNTNDQVASKETTELDLIVIKKIGDFNFKGILLNRSFDDKATDDAAGGNHFRLITSVNF